VAFQSIILALDHGTKRIGLAVSDPEGRFALGLDTLVRVPGHDPVKDIEAICQQYAVTHLLIGLPKTLKGEEGTQAQKVRDFAAKLTRRLGLPVVFWDERLTSKLAEQDLRQQGIVPSRNKGLIDQSSAKQLLSEYLYHLHSRTPRPRRAGLCYYSVSMFSRNTH
jgi:putative Holliday junction resolvase